MNSSTHAHFSFKFLMYNFSADVCFSVTENKNKKCTKVKFSTESKEAICTENGEMLSEKN